ncbi:hypothetical protein B0O44_1041, partial [Pedobacter nutrimenti]
MIKLRINPIFGLYFLFFLLMSSSLAFAEGSKDLYPKNTPGNRAFLYCNTNSSFTDSWPFKTPGTHYVYVKTGEVIAAGSSAQGVGLGTIRFTAPNGVSYNSGTSTSVGRINNRAAELAGPWINSGSNVNCYKPYTLIVKSGEEGVWKVDFIPPKGEAGTSNITVPDVAADADWTQGTGNGGTNGDIIAAWDVSVTSDNISWKTGRLFTNVLNLHIKDSFEENKSYYASHYVLTRDGRAYRIQTNGSNGVGFTFFSNNNGFTNNSVPTYKSLDVSTQTEVSNVTHDPRSPDDAQNVTHKIFYAKPAKELPASAAIYLAGTPGATTWLKNTAVLPKISDVQVVGTEGTIGQVSVKGAYIKFNSTTGGTYKIVIPVPSGADRNIIGVAAVGANTVFWDGKDGNNSFVPAGTTLSEIRTRLLSAEVHFPYIDMEINPKGIIIELTDNTLDYNLITNSADEGVYSDKVYWDDSNVSGAGTLPESSNPFVNLTGGASSKLLGHKWGAYKASEGSGNSGSGSFSFGNTKSMDTWAYIQGSEESQPLNMVIKTADLLIERITPSTDLYFSDHQLMYTVRAKNNGPSDVSGTTFDFKAPPGFVISSVNPIVISGTGTATVNAPLITGNSYQAKLDMKNQSVVEFTVVGKVTGALINQIVPVEASIMRPPDVTDPDATNPDSNTGPVNPHDECLNGTAISNCNNIKYNIVNPQEFCIGNPMLGVAYTLSIGGASGEITGAVPGWLESKFENNTLSVSGKPLLAGIYAFTLGTVNSEKEKTTVLIKVNPMPVITTQPASVTICEDKDATFTIVSSSVGNTYKWQYQNGGLWKDYTSAEGATGFNTSTLIVSKVTMGMDKTNIQVVVSSAFGCVLNSDISVLNVNPKPSPPAILPSKTAFCDGENIVLKSSADDGNQWYINGKSIPGAVKKTYVVQDTGSYTVTYTNKNGCESLGSLAVKIKMNPLPPVPQVKITGDTTFCKGGSVLLESSADTNNQWYKDGEILIGETGKTYKAIDPGIYFVLVTNENGCSSNSKSVAVKVNLLPVAPVITSDKLVLCEKDSATLSSNVTGTLQWYKDGAKIAGATGSKYIVKSSGKYSLTITDTNTCPSDPSNVITIQVNPLPVAPVITADKLVFCEKDSATLTSNVTGNLQWYKDGAKIAGATGSKYIVKSSGKYSLTITDTNTCPSDPSNVITIQVNPLP